jgi:hypothetical protein
MEEEEDEAFTKEDEKRVKDRLRALGYIDWGDNDAKTTRRKTN